MILLFAFAVPASDLALSLQKDLSLDPTYPVFGLLWSRTPQKSLHFQIAPRYANEHSIDTTNLPELSSQGFPNEQTSLKRYSVSLRSTSLRIFSHQYVQPFLGLSPALQYSWERSSKEEMTVRKLSPSLAWPEEISYEKRTAHGYTFQTSLDAALGIVIPITSNISIWLHSGYSLQFSRKKQSGNNIPYGYYTSEKATNEFSTMIESPFQSHTQKWALNPIPVQVICSWHLGQ